MGSSSSSINNLNTDTEKKFPIDKYQTMIFRVKLPSQPVISKEKDEKYLFYDTIEKIEKAKVFLNLGNPNLFNYFNIYNLNISFISIAPVVFLFFYRRFRIKKDNSRIKSFAKAAPLLFLYYMGCLYIVAEFQQESYFKFIKDDLMQGAKDEEVDEFLKFKYNYSNLLGE
jgi:hypothetical protein